jgi:putative DNA methylase
VKDYTDMFADFKANSTRLMTPSEFKLKNIGGGGFSSSLVRYLLFAINECVNSKSTIEGRSFLRSSYPNNEFWMKKPIMIEVLNFISRLELAGNMPLWNEHAYFAKILKESLKNEGI